MDIESNLSIVIPNHKEKHIYEVIEWCKFYYPKSEIIVEDDFYGKGKGYTLRNGLRKTTKDWVVFIDGDMDIYPAEIRKLVDKLDGSDIVIGTKITEGIPFHRKIITKTSRLLIELLFDLPLTDTQTGLKLFKRETLEEWETDGFLFDVEILYKAHKKGYKITEVPINVWISKKKGLKDVIKCTLELLSLWYRLLYR
jgi:glycosyltransferase involved in cell wall biosynthesis